MEKMVYKDNGMELYVWEHKSEFYFKIIQLWGF